MKQEDKKSAARQRSYGVFAFTSGIIIVILCVATPNFLVGDQPSGAPYSNYLFDMGVIKIIFGAAVLILTQQKDRHEYSAKAWRCSCGALVTIPECRFCPVCGERLKSRISTRLVASSASDYASTRSDVKAGSRPTCMVCRLPFSEDDSFAWCPHCNGIAHRLHLLEWLHVNRHCPICGEHLSETELSA